MKGGIQITDKNIRDAIKMLDTPTQSLQHAGFWIAPSVSKLNKSRYSGKGRPRKEDYDYIKNPVIKIIQNVLNK